MDKNEFEVMYVFIIAASLLMFRVKAHGQGAFPVTFSPNTCPIFGSP